MKRTFKCNCREGCKIKMEVSKIYKNYDGRGKFEIIYKGIGKKDHQKKIWVEELPSWVEGRYKVYDFKDVEWRKVYTKVKKRANKKNIECFSVKEFHEIINRSQEKCEMTDIQFTFEKKPGRHIWNPWMPSVDRIDSSKGYTLDNCRLVCWGVNNGLNQWGEEVFKKVCQKMVAKLS